MRKRGQTHVAEIDIIIEAEGWAAIPDLEVRVQKAAESAFAGAPHIKGIVSPDSLSIAILLADDATLQRLNAQFRGQDKPTNVLSFPAGAGMEGFLGDVALGLETCTREALEDNKTIADHLTHLVIHGTLHLLGYDHETEAEAETMENIERAILAKLGIADPYLEHRLIS
jgi:probable rRNA maturation factor